MPELPHGAERVVIGGTIRLIYNRPDGARVELSVTRGKKRASAVYAFQGFCGRLLSASARSWPVGGPEPLLGHTLIEALESTS
ncbi:hypothetical protein [Streptomyces sp. NPDC059761]|uniref:hypothetical protein n=1 Tax=Streptomyces sp. NPDC059761 TaxID=3346937 RepID=UPI003662A714